MMMSGGRNGMCKLCVLVCSSFPTRDENEPLDLTVQDIVAVFVLVISILLVLDVGIQAASGESI